MAAGVVTGVSLALATAYYLDKKGGGGITDKASTLTSGPIYRIGLSLSIGLV